MLATNPSFAVGEYWDSLCYNGGVPDHNQDAHRQRIVNWINAAEGTATAFDVTTKGILHAVFEVCATTFDQSWMTTPPKSTRFLTTVVQLHFEVAASTTNLDSV